MVDQAIRARMLDGWLGRVLETYPEQAAHALASDADPFHNPAGHTLRSSLAVLLDAVILGDGHAAVGQALAEVIRLRAVQDFTAAQAVGFLLALKGILRQEAAGLRPGLGPTSEDSPAEDPLKVYEDRLDRLMLLAFDLYVECREKLADIRINEVKRQAWLLDHLTPR